uniref:C2H2-type domain-containing protein n=1 Tax=Loa loa TaxID=7209 RepID=A0A1I7W3F4_LOALO
ISWLESYQMKTSRLEEHTDQDDERSLNLSIQAVSKEQTSIGRKRKMSREHTTHTSEKRFKCKISKKDFAAPSSLRTHIRTPQVRSRSSVKYAGKFSPRHRLCVTM